ncbi:hypothetical protein M0805_000896 [Coniferiporia weirii]|nr:hypothetical protein M0805_000896 [Coniferiporia weirii]
MSTSRQAPFLLTPRELKDAAASGHAKVVALDASWHMPNSPRHARDEFAQRRLPGARFLDLDDVASAHELGLKHMMPDAAQFARACESFGIGPDTHVVLYDSHGVFSSPRALFMFRAFGHENSSILDGGLPRWEAEGLHVEAEIDTSGAPGVEKTSYPEPALDEEVIKSYGQMVSNAALDPHADPTAALVFDARSNGRFTGKDPEPRPGLSSGHIPHALSLPFSAFLQTHTLPTGGTYTTFLPVPALRDALVRALGAQNAEDVLAGRRSVITSCGSGMTAGVLWLGLRMLGVQRPALYDESWTGYAMRPSSEIVKDV